jgi:hypothetical protein
MSPHLSDVVRFLVTGYLLVTLFLAILPFPHQNMSGNANIFLGTKVLHYSYLLPRNKSTPLQLPTLQAITNTSNHITPPYLRAGITHQYFTDPFIMSDSQSTYTMMSALTTDPSQGAVIDDDELMVMEVVEPVSPPLSALNSVFDRHNIELCIVGGKTGWKCGWCDKTFSPMHATRALKHLLKIKKCDIQVCKAVVPPQYLIRYQALHDAGSDAKSARKHHQEFVNMNVEIDQSSVGTLLNWCAVLVRVPSASISSSSERSTISSKTMSIQPSMEHSQN